MTDTRRSGFGCSAPKTSTGKRIALAVCCAAMLALLGFDVFIYRTQLSGKLKIDANVIASPFDISKAPPPFMHRDTIRVNEAPRSMVSLKMKSGMVSSGSLVDGSDRGYDRSRGNSDEGYGRRYRHRSRGYRHSHRSYASRPLHPLSKEEPSPLAADGASGASLVSADVSTDTVQQE